ncbi:TPA: hypothetical protein MI671_26780 [Klebsiella pneumoniae]|nr:hypothetical protein [Klebsiella pneumoniae]HBY7508362.1 hypothetical protein [Klebsiella pneumoniae]
MGSCAAPSAKGDDKFITTDYLQQCLRNRLYELLNGTRFREDLQRTAFMAPAESDMMCNTEATAGNQRSRSARMTGHARPEYAVRDIAEYWCQLQREMDDN